LVFERRQEERESEASLARARHRPIQLRVQHVLCGRAAS
jgi:hypothetical protein